MHKQTGRYGDIPCEFYEIEGFEVKVRGFEQVKPEHQRYGTEGIIPTRGTAHSAGYDFKTPIDFDIKAGEKLLVWTNIKAFMPPFEFLMIVPRSSVGAKKNIMLANTVGVIDADYYENEDNDGNIGMVLRNIGDETVSFKKGDAICQGIFMEYKIADGDSIHEVRKGGFGSSTID